MKIDVETVAPDQAARWLARTEGTTQRPISDALVNRLTAAIIEGRWQTTHQPIAITSDGVVIDGRHRLSAVVRSGKPVEVMVARGADPSTFLAVDTGRTRTPGDLLTIAGYHNTQGLAAATRYIIGAKKVRGTTNSWQTAVNQIRHDQIVAFVELNEREITNAVFHGSRIARSLGRYGLRTWISAAVYLIKESTVPDDIQNEFFERLADGAMLQPGSPILAVRRYITQSFLSQSNAVRPPVGIAVVMKAFNTYVAGGKTQLAIFKLGLERFPGIEPWTSPADHLPLPVIREDEGVIVRGKG